MSLAAIQPQMSPAGRLAAARHRVSAPGWYTSCPAVNPIVVRKEKV